MSAPSQEITLENTHQENPTFSSLSLSPWMLSKLASLGFTTPTPIQTQAIPVALDSYDVMGIAQTGTGKTLAFAIPMMELLEPNRQGLVLAPTRELAEQIEATYKKLQVRTVLIIGGANMGKQIRDLRNRPDVIIATPGRLLDHLQQKTVDLKSVSIVVLDEADRMLDMGFAPAIRTILGRTPKERQTMLFSATMPNSISDLAAQYMVKPVRIEVASAGTASELITQELVIVAPDAKGQMLADLLYENKGTVLVFARTRYGAKKLAKSVRNLGHSAAEIHSDRTLAQRREALHGFQEGRYRILVATDIAARGIDVKDISLVINYDLPDNAEDYVHRIGRTGRAGSNGRAVTIATVEQHKDVRDIERLIRMELPVASYSPMTLPAHRGRAPERGPKGNAPIPNRGRFTRR